MKTKPIIIALLLMLSLSLAGNWWQYGITKSSEDAKTRAIGVCQQANRAGVRDSASGTFRY